ncbi:hypothetical protein LRS05_09480 [Flavobacterium sp. J372]|uniref:hypothetical protein n=1 Tax=Flavobacterium sp. J372 TaxID=2898436 RepID=UPI002150DA1D|nr:hypothetical protein [Flavobacterium sp. J372]MCR5862363.1 hypothetical protein [Flavobacterium sp. J372]
MNKLVRELLLEDKKFEAIYDSFLHKVKNNDSARENLINSFFDIKANLKDLKLALGKMGNIDAIKDSIKVNEELIEKLKAELGLSDDEMTRYNELVARQQKLNFDITQIYNDYQKVVNYNDELKSMINDQVSRKEFFLSTLTTQSIKDFYKDRYSTIEELKSLIENISIELGVDESNSFFKDNIITQQLNPLQTELSHINEELKKYLKSIEIKDKILKLEKDILDDKERLNAIEQKNAEIELKRAAVKDDYRKIFDLYDQNYQEYVNLIEHFRERVKHLEDKSLTITGSVRLNIKKFRENMFRISNGISKSYKDFEIVVGTNNNTEFNYEEVKAQLQSIFKLMYNEKYVLVRNVDYKSAIKDLMKDYFFDHWEVSSLNDTLYNMSTGKASFVILKLIVGLSKSPGPLLIDQPEDNLDNRSITTDLITYLQDKKVQRQIIIVTHNPNIVVNADSENIVVAHQYGQNEDENDSELQFDYINGSLENSFEKIIKKIF